MAPMLYIELLITFSITTDSKLCLVYNNWMCQKRQEVQYIYCWIEMKQLLLNSNILAPTGMTFAPKFCYDFSTANPSPVTNEHPVD